MPRRMNSTVRNPPHTLMLDSPRPVEPAAPTSLSVYSPAPMIGLSPTRPGIDRKSTRLNSSHSQISYAVFCLKKKKQQDRPTARHHPSVPDHPHRLHDAQTDCGPLS